MRGRLTLRERLLVVVAAALLPLLAGAVAAAWLDAQDALEMIGLLVLSVGLAVWWLGGRLIVKPAKQILGTVRRLEQGRLDARVRLMGGSPRGEFARIAGAFNLMAESLERRQSDLQAELERSRGAYAVLDQVLNSMQEGLIAVTTNGHFLMFNQAAARLFPLDDAPVLPALWPEHFGFFHADRRALYRADELPMVRSALGQGGGPRQVFVRNALVPEGRVLQCSWQPIQGDGKSAGLVVFTDVTELQETQRKLIESQRVGRIGNWELDLRNGRLWWSDEMFVLFGLEPRDFDGTLAGFEQRVHPDDRSLLKPARDRALTGGQVMDVEYRMVRPDGSIAWMHEVGETRRNDAGAPPWFGGMVQDVTQRKLHEIENARLLEEVRELNAMLESRIADRTAQLARQEQLYRTLTEQAPEVVWHTDARGDVTYLNRAWYELVGGVASDWLAQGWFRLVHPDDREEVRAKWIQARDALTPYAGTRRILARDGSYHTMSYKGAPIVDLDGQVTSWVGIDADVTHFKVIESALRSSNQEMEAFSYSVSHDLRAPLGAIAGFARALEGKVKDSADEKTLHYLARIQAGVGKMEQLIDSLLQLSRVVRAPLEWAPVNLTAMARDTVEALQMQDASRQVKVDIEDDLVVHGDARLLRIVMENLLGNAWKFTSRTNGAAIGVGRAGDAVFVRDNGVGFDMAYADKLFTAFQRLHTEGEFPGTGIGLATVRRIVARHQGRVWVESEPDRGTTFYFALSDTAPPAWLLSQTAENRQTP